MDTISRKGDFFLLNLLRSSWLISGVEKNDTKYKEIKIQAHLESDSKKNDLSMAESPGI